CGRPALGSACVLGEVRRARHDPGAGDAGPLQKLAAVERGVLGPPGVKLGCRNPQAVGCAMLVRKPPQGTEKRCPRHPCNISNSESEVKSIDGMRGNLVTILRIA